MNPLPISATDAVSPAIETTKWMMFKPFQWSRWWRVGLIGLAAGEMASCNFNYSQRLGDKDKFSYQADLGLPGMPDFAALAPLIGLLIFLMLILMLVHLYIASVARFILFNGLLTGSFRIRQGFSTFQLPAISFFKFSLLFYLSMFVVIGLPVLLIFIAISKVAKQEGAGILLLSLLLLPFVMLIAVAVTIFYVLVKDFAVPIMALENKGVGDAIGQVFQLVKNAKGDYAGYIGMKIVLFIAAAVVTLIVSIPIMLVFIGPIVLMAVGGAISKPDLFRDPFAIALLITLALPLILLMVSTIAIATAPIFIFFQSYVVHFFARRYLPLWNRMYPPPPAPPAPPRAEEPPNVNPDGDLDGGVPPIEPAPAV